MKLYLVNVCNCINYSQFGPFLFEHIKNGDCLVYNSANDSAEFVTIYDKIFEDYNRNAFRAENAKLLFLIPRDMDKESLKNYDFYNKINIFMHITSKVQLFSEISILYVDQYSKTYEGEEYDKDAVISARMYADDAEFEGYLPICDENCNCKKGIEESVSKIKDNIFKCFFEDVLTDIEENMDDSFAQQMMKIFSSSCNRRISNINVQKVLINPKDIADRIRKTIKIIYFIKEIVNDSDSTILDFDKFSIDEYQIKEIIATYRHRLNSWLSSSFNKEYPLVNDIKVFKHQHNIDGFIEGIDGIVSRQLSELDEVEGQSYDVIKIVFDKMTAIIKNANEEMERFVQKDVEQYFDERNYSKDVVVNLDDRLAEEKKQKELTESLNQYSRITLPGFTEQLRLEQKLENANKQIDELLECKKNYSFKTFLGTFLFGSLGVAMLYLIAQFSVFVKENSFLIYFIYSAFICVAFFSTYAGLGLNYKRKMSKLLKNCKDEVADFLRNYKILAKEFEDNLNIMADYECLKDYLSRKQKVEDERAKDYSKYNWHKRKAREVLDNFNHFNDYVAGISPIREEKTVSPADFEHDEEHSDFYQVKIF